MITDMISNIEFVTVITGKGIVVVMWWHSNF